MKDIKHIISVAFVFGILIIVLINKSTKSSQISTAIMWTIIAVVMEVLLAVIIKILYDKGLPEAVDKRINIIRVFCNRNDISISDNAKRLIAEASYISEGWGYELSLMMSKYSNKNEWIGRKSKWIWLHIYLAAFPNVEIASDIQQQYNITVNLYFKNLIKELNGKGFVSYEECINYCNTTYLYKFDQTSFTLWERFMKEKGTPLRFRDVGQVTYIDVENKEMKNKYQ